MTLLLLLTVPATLRAQSWGSNPELNALANNMVKSLNEFMHRFNADEVPPFITDDGSGNLRRKCIVSLFDLEQVPNGESALADRITDFTATAIGNDIRLDITSPGLYAEARCRFSYKKKDIMLNLILVYENFKEDYWCWRIAGANGLEATGLDTTRNGYISPVDHAMSFTELEKAFPNTSHFRSADSHMDQLSWLSALAQSGVLKFEGCEAVVYHFTQVPGYLFTVSMHPRKNINTGWLIHDLAETTDIGKQALINQLLGR